MRMTWRTGLGAMAVLGCLGQGAYAQGAPKELSEKSVRVLMDYAWSILPARFTTPDGKVIEVDKKNKMKETVVPVPVAAEVIKVGYHSAQAQLCEMWEEQTANYDAMIRLQRAKHNWSEQQLLYITTLHRMTIHMAAGKLKVTKKDDEDVVTLEPITPSKDTCNDDKRKRVKEVVAAQIEAAKAVTPQRAEAPPTQALPTVQKK